MATTIYNGLEYSTKSINRNFRIKVNGIVDGKKKQVKRDFQIGVAVRKTQWL
jgi:hypothetical protein